MVDENHKLAQRILETGKILRDSVNAAEAKCMKERGMHARYGELTQAQLETVRIVRKKGRCHLNELAEALGISSPSASAMVERLVEKGILLRTASRTDRRKVVITLSESAREDTEAIEQAILALFLKLVDSMEPETCRTWIAVMERVSAALAFSVDNR